MTPVWADLFGMTGAFFLFGLVFIIPGFALGITTGVWRFGRENVFWSKSVLLSLVICPWTFYMLMRFVGTNSVWVFLGASGLLALLFGFTKRGELRSAQREKKFRFLYHVGLWAGVYLVVAYMMVDLVDGESLIRPLMSHDYVKHVAVTDAISRSGLVPANPSFSNGEIIPLFYYYFWFLLCSVVDLMGGDVINARHAVLGSIVWCGIALMALVKIYLSFLERRQVPGMSLKYLPMGLFLLLVTGLDFIPVTFKALVQWVLGRTVFPNALWWNDIVASWNAAVLWVPHHVGSFICCLLAFLWIADRKSDAGLKPDTAFFLVPIALISALGMSIWVAISAVWFLVWWFVFSWKKGWIKEVQFLVVLGVISLAVALPYIVEIQQANNMDGFPIALHIKPFYNIDLYLRDYPIIANVLSFIFLPLNYGLELGFFALGGIWYYKYRKAEGTPLSRTEWFLVVLAGSLLVFCTFFRSAIINNDLGWRGMMFVQFVLLLYSIPFLAALRDLGGFKVSLQLRQAGYVTLVLGLLMLVEEGYIRRFHPLGPVEGNTMAIREAYEWADENLPQDVIMQHNPDTNIEYFHALYGNRQVVVADEVYGRLYGIGDEMFNEVYDPTVALFTAKINTNEHKNAWVKHHNPDMLLVKETDPLWHDSAGWLNSFPVVFQNACCKIYDVSELKDSR